MQNVSGCASSLDDVRRVVARDTLRGSRRLYQDRTGRIARDGVGVRTEVTRRLACLPSPDDEQRRPARLGSMQDHFHDVAGVHSHFGGAGQFPAEFQEPCHGALKGGKTLPRLGHFGHSVNEVQRGTIRAGDPDRGSQMLLGSGSGFDGANHRSLLFDGGGSDPDGTLRTGEDIAHGLLENPRAVSIGAVPRQEDQVRIFAPGTLQNSEGGIALLQIL